MASSMDGSVPMKWFSLAEAPGCEIVQVNAMQQELVQGIARRLTASITGCAADASQFPVCINHGDLITQNLLFDRGVLSGGPGL